MDAKPWNHTSEAFQASILEDLKIIQKAGAERNAKSSHGSINSRSASPNKATSRRNRAQNGNSNGRASVDNSDDGSKDDLDYSPSVKRKHVNGEGAEKGDHDTSNNGPSITKLRRKVRRTYDTKDGFVAWNTLDDDFRPIVPDQERSRKINPQKGNNNNLLKENKSLKTTAKDLSDISSSSMKKANNSSKPLFSGKLTFKANIPVPTSEVVTENNVTRNVTVYSNQKHLGNESENFNDMEGRAEDISSNELLPTPEEYPYRYNNDYCSACHGPGNFLCCETCPNSFHFTCIDPPIEEKNLPDDAWYCNECKHHSLYNELDEQEELESNVKEEGTMVDVWMQLCTYIDSHNPIQFHLPHSISSFFRGVGSGVMGEYIETDVLKHLKSSRRSNGEERDPLLLKSKSGTPILCFRCHKSALVSQSILACDYCNSYWHPDCLNPPLATLPSNLRKWKCPNHSDHVTPRYRLPEKAKVIRVGLPRGFKNKGNIVIDENEDEPSVQTIQLQGKIRVVPSKPFKLNFLEQIRDNVINLRKMVEQDEQLCIETFSKFDFYATRDCELPLRILCDVANDNLENDDYVLALRDLLRISKWDPNQPVPAPFDLANLLSY
ncbi:Clr6 histone deacetylase associated PHD-finger protein Cph2 [Schizosaccharomyces pombe]|uniref:Uncharacterized protein C2F7.07c n=1 Tax=Schizosaccharomyces pombe (strain 972 / ATCC 24843) TaxID=284812 RepID=YA27_SCHPO|nr:Clr6 histone deacetylase-associated PHD protein-2 Cph2 [Schizosaccharomyces pombe]Q09698.1 RecName: Full=Uncharacterized protein C2F7.07c [Schizosaccharomyces pombe 972h-]8I02_G Chain G, Uncharacterized protein C2F7.07c [Schizosaccharomyces pombe]8IFG_P Chain P, Cph2 [Schizosaccharomyces pombe 972h-]CAA90494.1 Clr6 histone deacetylase associated PHD protein-2 Cph2 [Schizosaccharomyces pombe]|eukprot:NP_592978.1 Clr6 histone deacetylase-associated PHD protein-2 Cph2 [Schizosaccharomyces pombe]